MSPTHPTPSEAVREALDWYRGFVTAMREAAGVEDDREAVRHMALAGAELIRRAGPLFKVPQPGDEIRFRWEDEA